MWSQPIFPTGVVAIAGADKAYSELWDDERFEFKDHETKERTHMWKSVLDHPDLEPLKKWILSAAGEYLREIMQLRHQDVFITDSWANRSSKGHHQQTHNHKNSIISGVYYLQTAEDSPGLKFYRPMPPDQGPFISLQEHYVHNNPHTTDVVQFPVKTDQMIIFPSQMYHGHDANESDTVRINISWNALVEFEDNEDSMYSYRIKFKE